MPPVLALVVCLLFISWLFRNERKRLGSCSKALWIPLIWVLVVESKSPLRWYADITKSAVPKDGGGVDTMFFAALIGAGAWIIVHRRLEWRDIIRRNVWLVLYFGYAGLSVLWSEDATFSFKQWVKDTANVIMILIVVSEANPAWAVENILLKAAYIIVPVAVVLVKYFPNIGRVYDFWTNRPKLVGVSTDKNGLGATVFVCAIGLFWSFLLFREKNAKSRSFALGALPLMCMTLWLLVSSHSATSLACTVIGGSILALWRTVPSFKAWFARLGVGTFVIAALFVLCLHMLFDLGGLFVELLGRDLTFTGRTAIWERSLRSSINPFIGAGYAGFWKSGAGIKAAGEVGLYAGLQEAHNGYIEAYLNCGLLGLGLVLMAILSAARKIFEKLHDGDTLAPLRLTIVSVTLVYNLTEAAFSGLHVVWFVMLLAIVDYRRDVGVFERCAQGLSEETLNFGRPIRLAVREGWGAPSS